MAYHNDKSIQMLGILSLIIVLIGARYTEGDAEEDRNQFWANYERQAKVTDSYAITNGYADEDQGEYETFVDIGKTEKNPDKFDAYNLVKIEFILTWDDDQSDDVQEDSGDRFRMEVTPPSGAENQYHKTNPGDMEDAMRADIGLIIITIYVEDGVPEDRTSDNPVVARSENGAWNKVTSEKCRGKWRVDVECEDAGSSSPYYDNDDGNSYRLSVSISQYEIINVYDPTDTAKK